MKKVQQIQEEMFLMIENALNVGEPEHIAMNCPRKKKKDKGMDDKKGRNSLERRRRMAKPILLSGTQMLAQMMMMYVTPGFKGKSICISHVC
jgi:anaerobic ribonucleoside-triphosphate reductase